MLPTGTICPDCGAESTPPIHNDVHESHCPRSPQNTFDGRTGSPIEVDGRPARLRSVPDIPLVELSIDGLIGVVDELQGKVAVVSSERGRISKRLKDLKEARDKAVAELIVKWRNSHGLEPLPLTIAEEPEDEDDAGD